MKLTPAVRRGVIVVSVTLLVAMEVYLAVLLSLIDL
jgi:hypothetical protein